MDLSFLANPFDSPIPPSSYKTGRGTKQESALVNTADHYNHGPLIALPANSVYGPNQTMPSPPLSPSLSSVQDVQDPDIRNTPLDFRIGQRNVTAISAERLDENRTVYRLKIKTPSIVDYIPILFIRRLCDVVLKFCPYIKNRFPEWFLPPTVILKQRKTDWDNEFVNEKSIYRHLKPLQGTVIPYFYGEAEFEGVPAFVLSEVIGKTLFDSNDDYARLEGKLKVAYTALDNCRVFHGDFTLLNALDIGDRVMIVDFEKARVETDPTANMNGPGVGGLTYELRMHRQWQTGEWRELEGLILE